MRQITKRPWLAMALTTAALVGCSDFNSREVENYCAYGAVSQAQLDGCTAHVTKAQVEARDTNAARYAKYELDDCLADAGPFCRPRVEGGEVDPWEHPGP